MMKLPRTLLAILLVMFVFTSSSLLNPSTVSAQEIYYKNWSQFKAQGGGALKVIFYEEPIFAYRNQESNLTGIAIDVINQFFKYVEGTEGITIEPDFVAYDSFGNFYNAIAEAEQPLIGVGSITITELRKDEVDFSPAFFANKAVMITNRSVAGLSGFEEMSDRFKNKEMVVYRGTIQETYYSYIKENFLPNLKVKYVSSDEEAIETVLSDSKYFAYIDLPILFQAVKEGVPVKYHPKLDKGGEHFGFAVPKMSGFDEPLNQFFNIGSGFLSSHTYQKIVNRHLGMDINRFIKVASDELAMKSR